MKIPQFLPWVGKEEYASIESCFDINWITEGPLAKEFNERLLELTGAKFGVFAPNGTLAIYLALRAVDIGPGDEVIVPDFTFIGSANAVEMTGATPVFCDVNRVNFQIDVASAEKKITPHTKAVMPVHIYGTTADMDSVMAFAKKHNILVVEDAAQAIGVRYKGRHAGTFGKTSTFSFFADKTITTGEGGMIVTDDEKTYDRLLFLRNQGRKHRGTFIHPEMGYNFRMTDIQCAIGLTQLKKLPQIIERKNTLRAVYEENLRGIEEISLFRPEPGADWIPFRVGINAKRAHELMQFMTEKGIESRTYFYPLHRQPCYNYLPESARRDEDFPNAIYGYESGVCLPTFPTLKEEEVKYICSAIRDFYAS